MRRIALPIVLVLALAGFGSAAARPVAGAALRTPGPRPAATATVWIADFDYGPRTLRVRAGTRVTWRVSFRSKIPGLGKVLEPGLTKVFERILDGLARALDKGARA